MTPTLALQMFAVGFDTTEIAELKRCSEAEAYNALSQRLPRRLRNGG